MNCDTKSPSGPCPDPAYYIVTRTDRPTTNACLRCVTGVIFHGTNKGKTVTLSRVGD